MLIHRWDEPVHADDWRDFVTAQGFGHVVAAGRGRDVPVVVPSQLTLDGDVVRLHLARANPIFAALAEQPRVVISIAGDWAYIPSSWKAIGDEDPRRGIPTTYYAAVQLVGDVEVIDDPAEVAAALRVQLADVQPDLDVVDPAEHTGPLRAIRALRVPIDEVRAKFKYGGNADVAHREAIAAHLAARGGPGDAAARAQLRHQLDAR